jgi:hypothetical protein
LTGGNHSPFCNVRSGTTAPKLTINYATVEDVKLASNVPLLDCSSMTLSLTDISFKNINGIVVKIGASMVKVTLENLVFDSCYAANGAAIYTSSAITIKSSTFIFCSSTGNGGAVYLNTPAQAVCIIFYFSFYFIFFLLYIYIYIRPILIHAVFMEV